MGKLKVTYVRSIISRPAKHRRIIQALGLRKLNQTVIHQDNPAIRGMVAKVPHLVRMEVVQDD
ncbi:MAG: 50S ribosomal protein L30 [bacterium]